MEELCRLGQSCFYSSGFLNLNLLPHTAAFVGQLSFIFFWRFIKTSQAAQSTALIADSHVTLQTMAWAARGVLEQPVLT